MPKIQQYQHQVDSAGPGTNRRLSQDESAIGAGLIKLGSAALEVTDRIKKRDEQAEISDLAAQAAGLDAEFTNQWTETMRTAEPGDKTLVETFNKEVSDRFDLVGEKIESEGARQYWQKTRGTLQGHYLEKTMVGQMQLAGEKAKNDYTGALTNLSSTLVNDPSSFEVKRGLHKAQLDALVSSGNLPVAAARELEIKGEQELAKSAVRGWIDLDPVKAEEDLKAGKWNGLIDGDVKHQMFGEIRQAKNAALTEKLRQENEAERYVKLRDEKTQNEFLAAMNEGKLTDKDILKSSLKPFGSGSKETFLQLNKAQQEKKLKTDPGVFLNLLSRIHLPDNDPKKISNADDLLPAATSGNLTIESLNQLRKEIEGRNTPQGKLESDMKQGLIKIAKGKLTRSNEMTGLQDPEGDTQMLKFTAWFGEEYEAQRKAGKTPMQLLSPDSPDYLGKGLSHFQRSQEQIMQDMLRSTTGAPPKKKEADPLQSPDQAPPPVDVKARKPGESIKEWKARNQ